MLLLLFTASGFYYLTPFIGLPCQYSARHGRAHSTAQHTIQLQPSEQYNWNFLINPSPVHCAAMHCIRLFKLSAPSDDSSATTVESKISRQTSEESMDPGIVYKYSTFHRHHIAAEASATCLHFH